MKFDVNEENYESLLPEAIHDHPDLEPMAKMLMWHLLRQKKGWKFYDSKIMEFLQCGEKKLKNLFKQIKKAGYTTTVTIRSADGSRNLGSKRIFAAIPKFKEMSDTDC